MVKIKRIGVLSCGKIMGFAVGIGMAFMYNLVSSRIGGLEVEVETKTEDVG